VLAADYDPSLDRREDERKRFGEPAQATNWINVEEEEEEDVDDMFAIALSDKPSKPKSKKKVLVCHVIF